jgi:membrane dipeptidase
MRDADRPFDWWLDGHLDLAYLAVAGRAMEQPADGFTGCVSFPDLRAAPVRIALGTIFTEAKAPGQPGGYADSDDSDGAHRAGLAQLAWYRSCEERGLLRIIRTRDDLERCAAGDGPLGVVLLMECADPIRTADEAAWWHGEGLRVVGLSWAYGSRYAGGNANGGPLTPAGRDLVAALDDLGVLHDVSHLSDASFDDLLALTPRKVVASHSNCRALLEAKERHLTDEQIRAIAARGGVIGLNLYGAFLSVGREPTLDDCLAQVERVATLVGREHTALGSDLDGGFGPDRLPREIRHPRDYARLTEGLAERGWDSRSLAGFMHDNWLRTLRASLPG